MGKTKRALCCFFVDEQARFYSEDEIAVQNGKSGHGAKVKLIKALTPADRVLCSMTRHLNHRFYSISEQNFFNETKVDELRQKTLSSEEDCHFVKKWVEKHTQKRVESWTQEK